MMLVTFTWVPPSWPAMLPQKFSAAAPVSVAGKAAALVVDVLAEAGRPVTIADILASGSVPAQSTAYRNLAVLEQAGVVRKVFAGDEYSRYELSEDLTEHHHHMVCVNCGSVEDFTVPSPL